jgi:predicted PurR-regulated permease PerM
MLGLDQRAARATWTVFVLLLALGVVYLARQTIFVFIIALFFAYMLTPVISFIDSKLTNRRLPKNLVVALAYAVFIGALVGVGFMVGSVISEQAASLTKNLPHLVHQKDPLQFIPVPPWLEPMHARILQAIREQVSNLNNSALPLIQKAAQELLSHAEIPLFIVLVPILAFFFLQDGARIKDTVVVWASADIRKRAVLDEILEDIHVLLGSYIRALIILAFATFVIYTVVLSLFGVSYAILLGLLAAILEFLPVIGPLVAGVLIVLVAGFTGYGHILWIIGFLMLYRIFQDYVLSPHLMGSGVELHPLLVLFGVLAGEQIAGVPGMFLSVPIIATLRVIYVRVQRGSRQQELAPENIS